MKTSKLFPCYSIPMRDYFTLDKKSVLNSGLFDVLSKNKDDIDWEKCNIFACSNICKSVCDYWNENSNVSTNDIANKFKINVSTVPKYLRKGNDFGWCEYDGLCKKVNVYKDGNILKTYNSKTNLKRLSLNDLGIKINDYGFYKSIDNPDYTYKGYKFQYA